MGPKSLYLATLLVFNRPPPRMGSPGTIVKWMSTDGQGTKWRRNIAEDFKRLSRVHERYRQTDRRQTVGRQHIANVDQQLRCEVTRKTI